MKLTICLCIWISFLQFVKTDDPQNCAQPHFNQILSRTKRFLTFPAGSSFAVKRSFTKAIVQNIPRGLSMTVDIGLYYPLPVSTDSWDLTKLLYRLDLSHTGGLSATPKPKKGQDSKSKATSRIDNSTLVYPIKSYGYQQGSYVQPYGSFEPFRGNGFRTYYPGYIHDNSLNNHIAFKDPEYIPLSWNSFEGRIHRNDIQKPYKNYRRKGKQLPDSLESLGSIFKVNVKACILRAICEFNDNALPSGKSLIMDTAKIFFDVTGGFDSDDFNRNAKESSGNCAKRFLVSCPYSPFEFFSRNLRLKLNDQNAIRNIFPTA